jgi:hypothetical protein
MLGSLLSIFGGARGGAQQASISLDAPILKRNIFEMCFDTVVGVAEACGRGVQSISDGIGSLGGGNSLGGGMFGSMKEALGFGGNTLPPEFSLERAPAVEIAGPAPSLGKYEVSMCDLGEFSAPTFGCGASQSTGVNLR